MQIYQQFQHQKKIAKVEPAETAETGMQKAEGTTLQFYFGLLKLQKLLLKFLLILSNISFLHRSTPIPVEFPLDEFVTTVCRGTLELNAFSTPKQLCCPFVRGLTPNYRCRRLPSAFASPELIGKSPSKLTWRQIRATRKLDEAGEF